MPQRIAILAFEGISAFHLSIPFTVFGEDRRDLEIPPDDMTVCAVQPGMISTSMGLTMDVKHGLESLSQADKIIIPSWHRVDQPAPKELIETLNHAHQKGCTIIGLCLGAFPVAEAGLLDGRTATTHWNWANLLAKRFPAVTVDAQVLYIDHGDIVTSAGTAAGLDCCLHLLRKERGAETANRLARRLVIPPHRQGNQAQYVEQPGHSNAGVDRIARTLEWVRGRLGEKIEVDMLAQHAAMSRRTFTRQMRKATGMSVVQWLTTQRLFLAQQLLETTCDPIELIALKTGFPTALSLRQAFTRALQTTPTRYRREFGQHS